MLCSLRLVARITAVVLLAWTAVDLAYPECCLREKISTRSTATLGADAGTGSPERPDVDDCFCCARCIDNGVRIPRFDVEVRRSEFAEPVRHLATRASTLDHPPRNA